jgi:cold shock CspA family protein
VPRGEVLEFDEAAGYGTIRSSDGRDLFFHCTAISNGTRTISRGIEVTFTVVAGRLGRWEATAVEAISSA